MECRSSTWITAMVVFGFVSLIALTLGLLFAFGSGEQTFGIDHVNNTFLLNGKPFQYVSGSFHYFRALPSVWKARLRTMRMGGLNTVSTYVEWALHNPSDGEYNFEGIADIEKFIELAHEEGLYVILRPGPYICAERDNGGLPYWLFNKYSDIKPRTSDPFYLNEVSKWYAQLMPRLQRHLYGNGGSIIMVQVENEYGGFHACDTNYTYWLRDETEKYVKGKALLFTTDIPDERMHCGKIPNVFATTDFGIDRLHEIDKIWERLREMQPTGPLVNSEYYSGWLSHWNEPNQRRDAQLVADGLKLQLKYGASVNIYMYFGGTNFGFTAGANDFGFNKYQADLTSYDYDAVMDESGNTTLKYELIRNVLAEFYKIPIAKFHNQSHPKAKRVALEIDMVPILSLLSAAGRKALGSQPVKAGKPKTFEQLNQFSGLVLYETQLPTLELDPAELRVDGLRDRAFVYIDQHFIGTLSRESNINSLPLHKGWGDTLQLLVENQGRINFRVVDDVKGILGNVELRNRRGEWDILSNWTMTPYPLVNVKMHDLVAVPIPFWFQRFGANDSYILQEGPVLYSGKFQVIEPGDTYLNLANWGKGVAYVNDFNLGRYWPIVGPQITLYVPGDLLQKGNNTILLLEYQKGSRTVRFSDIPELDSIKEPAE